MPKKEGPKGRMSSYAFFVQCCREEHKKKHPGENVVFGEFTKKCAEKWKEMTPKEKKRFEDMAEKDKVRYQSEMEDYNPDNSKGAKGGKKRTKDPNAPKRALSAFFLFCQEVRPTIRAAEPGLSVGDVAKLLGKRWEKVQDKSKYEAMAAKEKKKYEKEMAAYKAGQTSAPKSKGSPAKKAKKAVQQEEEDDDDEDEDDDEEEEEDDDDDE